jgi:uncharacterized protein YktA (UPF0223 family)
MPNLKITDLKKYLKTKNNEELQKEIVEIVKNFKDVKEFYNLKLNPESEKETFQKYKKIVENEFFPDRGFGKLRYAEVNKAIKDFEKCSNTPELIGELKLLYAESGVEFTNTYGDIDERFYVNIVRAYDSALSYIAQHDLEDKFEEKAKEISDEASGIGWGFEDAMIEVFYEYYSSYEDEEEI